MIMDGKYINLDECYFHTFDFNQETFNDIILNGIKCKILQGYFDKENSYNGSFYISLHKKQNVPSYMDMLLYRPFIILDKSIKPYQNTYLSIFNSTPLPIRYSPYSNEYQKFLRISSDYFIGIGINLSSKKEKLKD